MVYFTFFIFSSLFFDGLSMLLCKCCQSVGAHCMCVCQQVRPVCQRSVKCASWIDTRMTDTSETHSRFRHLRLFSSSSSHKQNIINGCTRGLPSSLFFFFCVAISAPPPCYSIKHGRRLKEKIFVLFCEETVPQL